MMFLNCPLVLLVLQNTRNNCKGFQVNDKGNHAVGLYVSKFNAAGFSGLPYILGPSNCFDTEISDELNDYNFPLPFA